MQYFYGESTNAIKIQIWVTLIANLLLMFMQKRIKCSWNFSGLAKQVRAVLVEYKKALLQLQKQFLSSRRSSSQARSSHLSEGLVALSGITKPDKPAKWKGMIGYWLYLLPWYHIQGFFASRYVRWWFCTILFCVWLTSVFLTSIIASDNAKMHKVKEKYVLLREFAKLNSDRDDKADYIEFLYSDEEEHKKEIEDLWEQRCKK